MGFLKTKTIPTLFLFILGLSLQIQITLFGGENYNGLRLNLTDLFIPLFGLFILFSILLKQSSFPAFQIKHIYKWLFALSLIFIFALVSTHFNYEEINKWALINKFAGWFVLCAYFLMGAWLVQNVSQDDIKKYFLIAFYFFLIASIINIIASVMRYHGLIPQLVNNEVPMSALMANKNTFIFWALFMLSAVSLIKLRNIPPLIINLLWFLLPLIFICTGARAGYIAFIAIIPFLFYFSGLRFMVRGVLAFLLGILPIILIANTATLRINSLHWVQFDFIKHVDDAVQGQSFEEIDKAMPHNGDSQRLKLMYLAKDMIKERPLLGNGLGSNIFEQEKQWGSFVNVIDSTPLWLAAEFGLIGLSFFLIFYFIAMWHFWKQSLHSPDPFYQKLCQSIFLVMIVFGVMSLVHELLYTRFLWFFIGFGLAYPVLSKSETSMSKETS